jgi:hypothetical protein
MTSEFRVEKFVNEAAIILSDDASAVADRGGCGGRLAG